MKKLLLIAGLLIASAQPAAANTYVNDNLNAADQMFKLSMDGCPSVSIAIMAANNPDVYGPTSSSLRSEVARYARRCSLRF
jgi:nucleoside-specific outer membrane channel protein Tsx